MRQETLGNSWPDAVSWLGEIRADIFYENLSKLELRVLVLSAILPGVLALFIVYRYLRPVLPVRVRCWFCGGLNKLPPANENRFDCKHCDQYNGFSSLGDYNKDIPAQREPMMNVFSVGAAPSGKTLSMYHNGLCELCNYRQSIKMQLRNRFEPRDPRHEEAEFQAYCQHLEKVHPLCNICKSHVRNRIAYQDAKLLPHVMALEAASWTRRIQRLFNSEFTEFLVWFALMISFVPILPGGWIRLLPLIIALPFKLFTGVRNSPLVWCAVLRSVSVAMVEFSMGNGQWFPLAKQSEQISTILDTGSIITGLVGLFSPVQTFVARLCGRKKSSFRSKFTTLPNLTKALAPLLSPAHRAFVRSYKMIKRAPFDLEPRINSLNIGSRSRKSLSPGLGMSASTVGGSGDFAASPRAHSDFNDGAFGQLNRQNGVTPEAFQFGKSMSALGASPGIAKTSSVLRPSRLNDVIGGKADFSAGSLFGKSSPPYATAFGDFTPPPSQDSSGSEEFISASRLAKSSYGARPTQELQSDLYNGLAGLTRSKATRKDWDTKTSRTQHTVYSTVVHEHTGASNKALWAIAVLLALALAKLCWSDIVNITGMVLGSLTSGTPSQISGVCPAR